MAASISATMSRETVVASIAAVGVTAMALWMWNGRTVKKLHISYPHPQFPLILRLIAKLPKSIRKPLNIKAAAPKPPLDGIDLLGPEYNPFEELRELVENKIWRVRYKFIRDPMILVAMKDIFGVDLNDPMILEKVPKEKRADVQSMMDAWAAVEEMNQGLDPKQQALNELKAGYEDSQDMLVARLENNNGDDGLLLYNPCRMHPQILEWLHQLKIPVKYIVSGSSSHTNMLPQAAAAFPSAKIISSEAADLKCLNVGMRQADFIYTDYSTSERGYQAVSNELGKYDVKICHIAGDVTSQSLLVVVHGHLFDTDLTCYGNGHQLLHVDQEDWDDCCKPSMAYAQKWFHTSMIDSSVPGYLPNYRLMGMDASSPFCKFLLDEPKPDGSSCTEMAASLQAMLNLDFAYVDNVHSKKKESLPAQEFKRCVVASWSWLDEKSQ